MLERGQDVLLGPGIIDGSLATTFLDFSGAVDAHSSACLAQLKDRILKLALEKHPQLLSLVDNHEIKAVLQQVLQGIDVTLTENQILAVSDWMDSLGDAHNDRRR